MCQLLGHVKKCQLYDVQMSSRPVTKPSTFWSSVRSVAESTCGLSVIDDPKRPHLESAAASSFVPLPESVSADFRPFLSCPRLDFADLSSLCTFAASPVQSSSVAALSVVNASPVGRSVASPVQSSPVTASSVVTALPVGCSVAASPVRSSSVTVSSSPVAASSVH